VEVSSGRSATQGKYVEFWGVYRKDVGHDIDVHITRGTGEFDEAVPNTWIVPPIAIGVGCVLGVAAVIGIVRPLRSAPMYGRRNGRPGCYAWQHDTSLHPDH